MNDSQIESLLRKAPRLEAPMTLKSRLQADIRLAGAPVEPMLRIDVVPFWRRWFPALSFGIVLLGCIVVLAVQTNQLLELRRENSLLRAQTANLEQIRRDNAELERLRAAAQATERRQKEQEELLRLRTEVIRLRAASQEVSVLRAENQRLQTDRNAAAAKAGVIREEDPLRPVTEKADRISCINNIKQIGLAARMWANEHKTNLPADFISMTNELTTPKVLTCAGDTARTRAQSWEQFDGSSVSYEMLSPGATETDPAVVYVRCPVHNNVGLCDGSAQQLGQAFTVQKVDGKFKIVRLQSVTPKPAPQP